MFTGLIECQGIITRVERVSGGLRLEVYAPEFGRDMAIGDSIAVDGSCLTVAKFIRGAFIADVSEETMRKTTLGKMASGAKVNLERAMRMSDRLGGHMVSGHVDGVGSVVLKQPAGNSTIYQFKAPEEVLPFLAPKGSVAVDGISLTVARVLPDGFTSAVIPHTEQVTTLGEKNAGSGVNMEADTIAKYVRNQVEFYLGTSGGSGTAASARSSGEGGKRGLADLIRDLAEGK